MRTSETRLTLRSLPLILQINILVKMFVVNIMIAQRKLSFYKRSNTNSFNTLTELEIKLLESRLLGYGRRRLDSQSVIKDMTLVAKKKIQIQFENL